MIFVISMDLFSGDKTCYGAFDVTSTCLISLLDIEMSVSVSVCVPHIFTACAVNIRITHVCI